MIPGGISITYRASYQVVTIGDLRRIMPVQGSCRVRGSVDEHVLPSALATQLIRDSHTRPEGNRGGNPVELPTPRDTSSTLS